MDKELIVMQGRKNQNLHKNQSQNKAYYQNQSQGVKQDKNRSKDYIKPTSVSDNRTRIIGVRSETIKNNQSNNRDRRKVFVDKIPADLAPLSKRAIKRKERLAFKQAKKMFLKKFKFFKIIKFKKGKFRKLQKTIKILKFRISYATIFRKQRQIWAKVKKKKVILKYIKRKKKKLRQSNKTYRLNRWLRLKLRLQKHLKKRLIKHFKTINKGQLLISLRMYKRINVANMKRVYFKMFRIFKYNNRRYLARFRVQPPFFYWKKRPQRKFRRYSFLLKRKFEKRILIRVIHAISYKQLTHVVNLYKLLNNDKVKDLNVQYKYRLFNLKQLHDNQYQLEKRKTNYNISNFLAKLFKLKQPLKKKYTLRLVKLFYNKKYVKKKKKYIPRRKRNKHKLRMLRKAKLRRFKKTRELFKTKVYAIFRETKNNFIITCVKKGKLIKSINAGICKFKGRTKRFPHTAYICGLKMAEHLDKLKIKVIIVVLKARKKKKLRESLRGFMSKDIKIIKFIKKRPRSHNGIRHKKQKRK
jgi:ribosomal protein S11